MRIHKLDSIHLIIVSVNPPTKSIHWIRMDYLVVDPRPFSGFRVVDDAAKEPVCVFTTLHFICNFGTSQ